MIKKLIPIVALATLVSSAFAGEIPAAKLALAEKTIAAMHMEETMKSTMVSVTKSMKGMTESMINANGKKLPPEALKEAGNLQDNAMKIMLDEMSWDKLKPMYVQVYAECYTEPEMKAMIAFYGTAEGSSILAKTPAVTQKSMELMQGIMMKVMPKVMAQIEHDTENLTKKVGSKKSAPVAK